MTRSGALFALALAGCTMGSQPEAPTASAEPTQATENIGTTGAAPVATTAPTASTAEAPFSGTLCGDEVVKPAAPRDEAKRACLWDAWKAGKPARLAITVPTVEGDPIRYVLEVLGPNTVQITRDTSKDAFGPRGVTTYACSSLAPEPAEQGAKGGFVAQGCKGGEGETIHVP